jgi:hypothetical protein
VGSTYVQADYSFHVGTNLFHYCFSFFFPLNFFMKDFVPV